MLHKQYSQLVLLLFFSFNLAACAPAPPPAQPMSALPPVSPTYSQIPILPVGTAQPTPWPTIDPALSEVFYQQLLTGEIHACQLPCLWGIQPSTSTWETLNSLFKPILQKPLIPDTRGSEEVVSKIFPVGDSQNSFLHVHFVGNITNKQIIRYVRVHGTNHPPASPLHKQELSDFLREYSVKAVLTEMGPPSEILLIPQAGGGGPGWSIYSVLLLYYYDIGVLYEYSFNDLGNMSTVCPDHEKMTNFTLVASHPDHPFGLFRLAENYGHIEDITDYSSVEEFTQQVIASPDSFCF